MTNLSILEINTRDGMSDDAFGLYMRGKNTGPQEERGKREFKAFWMACEWQDRVEPMLRKIVFEYEGFTNDQTSRVEIYNFLRERFYRKFFPGGRDA